MQDNIISIQDLTQDSSNFNKGTDKGARLMRKSFKKFGAGRSILVDRDGNIIAGNKSTEAAKEAGITKVRVIETDGSELIAVKRTDVSLDSKEGRELALADNAATYHNLDWDVEQLQSAIKEFDDFNTEEWDINIPEIPLEFNEPFTQQPLQTQQPTTQQPVAENVQKQYVNAVEDDFDEEVQQKEERVKRGEIWQLGDHRLMCGDSTSMEDVQRLMDGVKADCVLTDPPYGISIVRNNKVGGDKPFSSKGTVGGNPLVKANRYAPIIGDNTTETAKLSYKVMQVFSKDQIIFGGNYFTDFLEPRSCWLVWDKENSGNFADVELAWTSFNKGAKLYRWLWNGLCRKGERAVELKTRIHPTQKPVGLLGKILEDFTTRGGSPRFVRRKRKYSRRLRTVGAQMLHQRVRPTLRFGHSEPLGKIYGEGGR